MLSKLRSTYDDQKIDKFELGVLLEETSILNMQWFE